MRRRIPNHRRGSIIVLAVVMLVVVVGVLAFALDFASIHAAKSEMQRSADASAMAACWELYRQKVNASDQGLTEANVFTAADQFAHVNSIVKAGPHLTHEASQIQIGYIDWLNSPGGSIDTSNFALFNSVEITVKRTATVNGELPYYFARFFGITSKAMEVRARAGMGLEIDGFELPGNSSTRLNIMPFAVDEETWNAMLAGTGPDNYAYDENYDTVSPGSDGILEINMYPEETGSQANRGTVDVGGGENSTSRVERQILDGISRYDLQALGKPLELNDNGELDLTGDPGFSVGFKDELDTIIGEPRVIMVFREMHGDGNNGVYKIVKFVGVRLMAVKLNGNEKARYVTIQPAATVVRHVKFSTGTTQDTSDFLYSPVILYQ